MSRKYRPSDMEVFKAIFLQFPWIPPAHLARMMQVMAETQILPDKWKDFHLSTASRWINEGQWRDQVESLQRLVDYDQPLPTDDQIDDQVMRYNLYLLDLLMARIQGDVGDFSHNLHRYTDLQREVRLHVLARQAIPLTPTQLIELFVRAGYYAAGQAFDAARAKDFLIQAFSRARQLAPAGGG